ncbi:sodium- and chloride-dependent neutral and basic amino acid transporter B(0+)-like [Carcharodon carcharias]|uniref:sodium- and chloride-dependent neutral and basic amino acid transporter B(0+)-like n=1 Tax=Carcharodon carcharias TaxID=13397 RepID=UPI001B7DA04C|nr:sodium- and chloride-dependent neutral and basic amino acid transporter B(0+)-like [Carcharodon carcharias]
MSSTTTEQKQVQTSPDTDLANSKTKMMDKDKVLLQSKKEKTEIKSQNCLQSNVGAVSGTLHYGKPTNLIDDDEHLESTDENLERGNWALKADYLLSVVGYAVGLGNVWRFPFLVYKNGGGAFLIPYLIMLSLAGLPMFFMESSLGQFASLGPPQVWKVVPILQGVGILMFLVSAFQGLYSNCIISYCLFYFFVSFQSPLPWENCYSWWDSDETCRKTPKGTMITSAGAIVLHRSRSINETGGIVWHLALCLLLSWLVVFLVLCKGIKFSGKVAYFFVTFPYLGLVLLLIRGVTLEGASQGIEFYIGKRSDFSKLADAEVWKDATTQIFYSLSVSLGGTTALSSYNKFHNDCYTDTIIVGFLNCLTSLLIGFVIFATLGHMSLSVDVPVSEISHSGLGLVFLAYPEALLHLPISPLWSVIFFGMIITMGLTSQFAIVETIITSIQDEFPTFLRSKRLYVTIIVCLVLYLLGLVLATEVRSPLTGLLVFFVYYGSYVLKNKLHDILSL